MVYKNTNVPVSLPGDQVIRCAGCQREPKDRIEYLEARKAIEWKCPKCVKDMKAAFKRKRMGKNAY